MKLKEDIDGYFKYNYSQVETVELLLKKGYSENEIKAEIYSVYTKIVKEDIVKSFSFLLTTIVVGLLSITPLVGYVFHFKVYYGIFSILLLVTTYGYYKLNNVCIIIWLILVSIVFFYLLIVFFIKLSGGYVNATFSFPLMISVILFCSMMVRNILSVYSKNKKFKKQYAFK